MLLNEFDSAYKSFLAKQKISDFNTKGNDLVKKYNDPEFDQLNMAKKNVNDAKIQMKQNLNNLIDNNDDLNELDEGAEDMRNNAHKFQTKTKSLERIMWWKKVKMTICIVLIVIAIIVFIILMAKFL